MATPVRSVRISQAWYSSVTAFISVLNQIEPEDDDGVIFAKRFELLTEKLKKQQVSGTAFMNAILFFGFLEAGDYERIVAMYPNIAARIALEHLAQNNLSSLIDDDTSTTVEAPHDDTRLMAFVQQWFEYIDGRLDTLRSTAEPSGPPSLPKRIAQNTRQTASDVLGL